MKKSSNIRQSGSRVERIKQEKKKRQKRKLAILLLLMFICALLIFLVFRIPATLVNTITISGNQSVSTEVLSQKVQEVISGKYLYTIPKKNIFLISKSKLENELKKDFPKLDMVRVKKHPFSSISIVVSERTPEMLYCEGDISVDKKCFFITKEGIVFEEAPHFSSPLYFVLSDKTKNTSVKLGESVFDQLTLNKIQELKRELDILSITPTAYIRQTEREDIIMIKHLSNEKDFGIDTPRIIFKDTQSISNIVSNLLSALKSEKLKESQKNNFTDLDYIDLRFDEKVFYKLKKS